jgi:hypothetical protein
MKQIICDGCKVAEELKEGAKAGRSIKAVQLQVWEDERESVPRIPIPADLCSDCRTEMQNKYFRGTVDNTEAIMPQSLKALSDD